jgi:hypothetical protein
MKTILCLLLLLLNLPVQAQLNVLWTPPDGSPSNAVWEVWAAIGTNALTRLGETTKTTFVIPQTPTTDTMVLVFGRAGGIAWPAASTNWTPVTPVSSGNLVFTRTNVVTVTVTNVVTVTNQAPAIVPSIVNGGFTNGLTGWLVTGVVDSAYGAARFNSGDRTPSGAIVQTVSTSAGARYTLNFDAGILAFTVYDPASNTYKKWPQAVTVTIQSAGVYVTRTLTLQPPAGTTPVYSPQSIEFYADSSRTTITFKDASTATASVDLFVDNVTIR